MNTTQTNVRRTLLPLLSIALIMALFSFAQTFAASNDDFNDNIKNTSKWGTDKITGSPDSVLTETNQRLEYTHGFDDLTSRQFTASRPWILTQFAYNADWAVQIDTFNVTSPGPLGFLGNGFGINIFSPHTWADSVSAELYSLPAPGGGPVRRGFASQFGGAARSGSAYSGDIGATNGAVRIAFDSATKVITVFYDREANDGYQWVEYGSFGIAGAGGANGNTDWGLVDGDQFSAFVYGRSAMRQSVTSGQMFGDNFMETGGVPPNGPPSLGNISTRGRVETGNDVLIGGFIVDGTQPKKVMVRAIGPSLGLADKLANPTLELRNSTGTLLKANDDWKNSPNQQAIINSTIPPRNDLESAIVATLPANRSAYTAIVRGANNTSGIGLVEIYDLDRSVDSKLANISTRGLVQTGDKILIAGTIVLGPASQKVIIRAIGPSLNVAGKLFDPTLELRDANGSLIRTNDNWRTGGQEAEIIATTIPPTNDFESAIVATLPGAPYTAIVRGVSNTTGIALVEVYALN